MEIDHWGERLAGATYNRRQAGDSEWLSSCA